MRNSKTLEFMSSLNEKINKDNIEINKAIANPKLGKNLDKIKAAGYDIDYDGDLIKNPKTGKRIWPKNYSREEKKKVDFKGKLDSNRENIRKTRRSTWDQEDNRIPKSARVGGDKDNPVFIDDEADSYSPVFNDMPKKSTSANINYYKRAVKDRDEARDSAERNKKSLGYYEKKVQDAQKDLDRQKGYIKDREKEADRAENKRKELMNKVREKRTSVIKEGAEPLAKKLKKKLKESWTDVYSQFIDIIDKHSSDEENYENNISKEVEELYSGHKGEPDWDKAYEKWLENSTDETLTEARQEEILSKLPKKKLKESLGDKYEVWQKYYEDGKTTTEYVQSFDSYEKAQKFADGLNQDPDCEAWVKDLKESKEVCSEPVQEQTLNEETVGEKITSPSGKFWVGDPCYVLSDDVYYGIWDDKYNFEDGIIDCGNGLSFLVHGTAYGDGCYPGNGFNYGVDSGTLAVIPMELVAKTDGIQFGTVETSNTAWLDYNDGTFDITLDNGAFSIETSETEDDDDPTVLTNTDDDFDYDEDDLDESEEVKTK